LAAVKTPPAAVRLRSVLLQIVGGEAALTREFARLVDFLPRFSAALRPLAPATTQLELALAQLTASTPAGVTAAYAGARRPCGSSSTPSTRWCRTFAPR
jgi:hypothetical protein